MHLVSQPDDWQEETTYWVAASELKGLALSSRKLIRIYERLGSLKGFYEAGDSELKSMSENRSYGFNFITDEFIAKFREQREKIQPAKLMEKLVKCEVRAYPLPHPAYPMRLREIHDPPSVLYVRGQIDPAHLTHAVGMVGTRHPSSYGQNIAKRFSRELAQMGVSIISGMAFGIDSFCHWGAIDVGGSTVAVLGCGADQCYPSTNKPLYAKLIEKPNCGVVSEFFPGTRPEKWMFPARNRIIAGLSQGLLVIEAGKSSGSLITAKQAFEQNRQVFAIPGQIYSETSEGTNQLIGNSIAQLVVSTDQILNELALVKGAINRETTVVELFGREKEIYDLIVSEPVHFDQLSSISGMGAGELSSVLTMLELGGVVERLPGDFYARA